MSKTARTHIMHYELLRSRVFTTAERSVFTYINSYSTVCRPGKLEFMAYALGMSERHLRRVLKSLQLKGLIRRLYGLYKRIRIVLATWDEQNNLWKDIKAGRTMLVDKNGNKIKSSQSAEEIIFWKMLKNAASQPRKIFKQKSYRTSVSGSILERNNLLINTEPSFKENGELPPLRHVERSKSVPDWKMSDVKNEALAKFYAAFPQLLKN